jgi:LuxR family maltose regulon positive regulatory protein
MDAAVAAVERAGDLPERLGGLPYLRATLTWVAAGAAYAAGRPTVAGTVLDEAAAAAATELDHALGVPRLALRARIARLRNDRSALEQLEFELATQPRSAYAERLGLAEVSVQAQAAWAARELDRAEDILRSGLSQEERLRLVPGVGSLHLDLAMVLADAGRGTESMRELGVVLTTAERRGWVGRLVEAGPEVVPLLELAVKRGVATKPAAEALELLRGSAQYATTSVPGTDEVLSAREMEVLVMLAEGASNADLAARLFVSVNTAKTHVGRILTKLDARSRTEAVARARALYLL